MSETDTKINGELVEMLKSADDIMIPLKTTN